MNFNTVTEFENQVAEFFGAMFCAGAVTGTLSISIIPSLDDTSTT
jgi:hypothetical protein